MKTSCNKRSHICNNSSSNTAAAATSRCHHVVVVVVVMVVVVVVVIVVEAAVVRVVAPTGRCHERASQSQTRSPEVHTKLPKRRDWSLGYGIAAPKIF